MSSNFCFINPKNSLAKDVRIQRLVGQIVEKASDIPNHPDYRNNMEYLKMVCLMVENAGIDNKKNKGVKIDKKDIVFQVWQRLFSGLKPEHLKDLEANIQYLWENGQIYKKSFWNICKHSVWNWFERKILN